MCVRPFFYPSVKVVRIQTNRQKLRYDDCMRERERERVSLSYVEFFSTENSSFPIIIIKNFELPHFSLPLTSSTLPLVRRPQVRFCKIKKILD